MSKGLQIGIGIVIVVAIILVIVFSSRSTSSITPTSDVNSETGMTTSDDSSSPALQKDTAAIDAQMQGLDQDSASLNASDNESVQ